MKVQENTLAESHDGAAGCGPARRPSVLSSTLPHALWPQWNLFSLSVLKFQNSRVPGNPKHCCTNSMKSMEMSCKITEDGCQLCSLLSLLDQGHNASRAGNHQHSSKKWAFATAQVRLKGSWTIWVYHVSFCSLKGYPDNVKKLGKKNTFT